MTLWAPIIIGELALIVILPDYEEDEEDVLDRKSVV